MATCKALFGGKPGKEQAVGRHIFPIRQIFAAHTTAVSGQKVLQFLRVRTIVPKPESSAFPNVGVLVDDHELAAGLHDPAHFIYGALDIDRVFQRFGGICEVERRVGKGQFGHRSRSGMNTGGNEPEHLLRNVQPPDFRFGVPFLQNPRKPPLAAPDVQHTFIGQDRRKTLAGPAHAECADRWSKENAPRPATLRRNCGGFPPASPGSSAWRAELRGALLPSNAATAELGARSFTRVSGKSAAPSCRCRSADSVPCCTSSRYRPCAGRVWDRESAPPRSSPG